jgi:hypothetical protein
VELCNSHPGDLDIAQHGISGLASTPLDMMGWLFVAAAVVYLIIILKFLDNRLP